MASTATGHQEIRHWAERHGGKAAVVKETHHQRESVGILRIMFPQAPHSEHEAPEEISWDEFFQQFDNSNFSKLVSQESVEGRRY